MFFGIQYSSRQIFPARMWKEERRLVLSYKRPVSEQVLVRAYSAQSSQEDMESRANRRVSMWASRFSSIRYQVSVCGIEGVLRSNASLASLAMCDWIFVGRISAVILLEYT